MPEHAKDLPLYGWAVYKQVRHLLPVDALLSREKEDKADEAATTKES